MRIIRVPPNFNEIQADFEREYPALIKNGLHLGAMPLPDVMITDDTPCHPLTHTLEAFRPCIFDIRLLPKNFRGFKISYGISADTIPDEFRLDEDGMVAYDICWSPERIIAYAEEHAPEICEQLNDYTFTLKNICDMIADGDFERHKKFCEEERVRRLSGEYEEEEDLD